MSFLPTLAKMIVRIAALFLWVGAIPAAHAGTLPGIPCQNPPLEHCGADCGDAVLNDLGNAQEPKSGRRFFLDYPCDLKSNEKVIFILNLHGAGSTANWQRHYFPLSELKEKYRLVIATPTAVTLGFVAPFPVGFRIWDSKADDRFLEDIAAFVFASFGRDNIKAFWLAGHSQGGVTANRLVCANSFKYTVDGWLSLSGGRIGAVTPSKPFANAQPESSEEASPEFGTAVLPTCNISYIFVSGESEIVSLPETSPWAQKYRCGARLREPDVIDAVPGYVHGETTTDDAELHTLPHTAEVFTYPHCKRSKLVADVYRLGRDHADGLGPNVTEAITKLIVSAPGGKVRDNR
jgi:hypothetical protein